MKLAIPILFLLGVGLCWLGMYLGERQRSGDDYAGFAITYGMGLTSIGVSCALFVWALVRMIWRSL